MSRKMLIGGAGAAVGVVVGVGAFALFQFRNTTTPVNAETAVSRFEEASSDRTTPSLDTSTVPTTSTADESAAPPSRSDGGAPSVSTSTPLSDDRADDAVAVGAAGPGEAEPVRLPLPEPGVYRLTLRGSESTDLLTGATHDYPEGGFLTVTAVECGVEVRVDFIVERWQSVTLCEGEDGPEIVAEQVFHSFFGQDDLLTLTCTDSPLGPGVDSWSCTGESSIAERAVTTSIERRQLGDGSVSDVLIVATELLVGDHPDNVESIEQWWHLPSGLLVFEQRTYDFVVETPIGSAGYVEEYELMLTSLEPIT